MTSSTARISPGWTPRIGSTVTRRRSTRPAYDPVGATLGAVEDPADGCGLEFASCWLIRARSWSYCGTPVIDWPLTTSVGVAEIPAPSAAAVASLIGCRMSVLAWQVWN